MASKADRPTRIRELDGLRAIAALAVVHCHYFAWIPYSGAAYGWLGVDLFFVLSGFLITGILLDLRPRPGYFRTFYARRALRIFPPYYFVLGGILLYSIAVGRPGSLGLWSQYFFYAVSLRPLELSAHPLTIPAAHSLIVFWSLSVEEIFYLVWAPAVRFLRRERFWMLPAALIVAAPVFRLLFFGWGESAYYTLYCRMDGLAFGALAALLIRARRRAPARYAAADRLSGRAALVLAALFVLCVLPGAGAAAELRLFVVGITIANAFFAAVVYYVASRSGEAAPLLRALRWKPLCSVGMVSYAVYLVHCPALELCNAFCGRLGLAGLVNVLLAAVAALALTLAVSYAMWYGFELRLLRAKDRFFSSSASPPAAHAGVAPANGAADVAAKEAVAGAHATD